MKYGLSEIRLFRAGCQSSQRLNNCCKEVGKVTSEETSLSPMRTARETEAGPIPRKRPTVAPENRRSSTAQKQKTFRALVSIGIEN